MSDRVAKNLDFELVEGGNVGSLLTCRLLYVPHHDPTSIHLVFANGRAWVVERAVLAAIAMDGGWVIEPPLMVTRTSDALGISYQDWAAVKFDLGEMAAFLRATEELVPVSTELDYELNQILEGQS